MTNDEWPFDQPRNCGVITLRSIVFGGKPILHVTHDEDDHGWQFLGAEDADLADAALVCLEDIVRKDPTVLEVADLPVGWHAWREAVGAAWGREKNEHSEG
jgi:hypothetical protein